MKRRIVHLLSAWSDFGAFGGLCSWATSFLVPGYKRKVGLAALHESGFTSHSAMLVDVELQRGKHVYVGDRVVIYGVRGEEGLVKLEDGVQLYSDIMIENYQRGKVLIGEGTHIQSRCHLAAAINNVEIGKRCEIAQACAFYSYNHSFEPDLPIQQQPVTSSGPIVIGDDVWLGYGVVVLEGVKIGSGAVIGANSVVTADIPENAIAVGSPARVVRQR